MKACTNGGISELPAPCKLKCEQNAGLGISDRDFCCFSWLLPWYFYGAQPVAAELEIAERVSDFNEGNALLWRSGWVANKGYSYHLENLCLPYQRRVFFRVRVRDAVRGDSIWSCPKAFVTGLGDSNWPSPWIGSGAVSDDPAAETWAAAVAKTEEVKNRLLEAAPVVTFSRQFDYERKTEGALLWFSACGAVRIRINEQLIEDAVLDPAQTDYAVSQLYRVFEIDTFLLEGDNKVEVELAGGWYQQPAAWGGEMSYGLPCFSLFINDGKGCLIAETNNNWKARRSSTVATNLYAGEAFNGGADLKEVETVELPGRQTHFRAQNIPSIGIIERLRPEKCWRNSEGWVVVDFGINIAGTMELELEGQEIGQPLFVEYVEQITEGDLPDRSTIGFGATHLRQMDCCIPGLENSRRWSAKWGYKGFRYALIKGWKGSFSQEKFVAFVMRNKIEKTGRFCCSEPILNDLYQIACRSMEGNLHGVFEDCPAREKCGWTGDVLAAYRSWWLDFDLAGIFEKFLNDLLLEGSAESIPFAIVGGRRKCGQWLDFGASCVILPHVHYHQTGDTSLLQRHFAAMRRFCESAFVRLSVRLEEANMPIEAGDWYDIGLGDWYDLAIERGPDNGGFPVSSSALLMTSLRILEALQRMSAISEILDKEAESSYWTHAASIIEKKIISIFYKNENEGFGSIASNAFALYLRLDGRESIWLNALGDQLDRQDWHANVGCFGHGLLTPTLANAGRANWALKTLMAKGYPGFRDCLERGATTLWEDQGAQLMAGQDSVRSLNHPFHAGYVAFLHSAVGGVRVAEGSVAWDRLVFDLPLLTVLSEGMTVHESVRGKVASHWKRSGERIDWWMTIPPGAEASVFFFKGTLENLGLESAENENELLPEILKNAQVGRSGLHCRIKSGSYHFSWRSHVFGHLT